MTISATTQGLRMGVATSTSRPTVPFDGQVISETDTDSLKVYNGTAWVGVGGLVPVAPTSVAVGSGSATTSVLGQVTYSGASSVSLNGVFTSSYRNYKMVLEHTCSTATDLKLRLRAAGTDNSTASSYVAQLAVSTNAAVSGSDSTNNLVTLSNNITTTLINFASNEFFNPQIAAATGIFTFAMNDTNGGYFSMQGATHNQTVSYDGFTIFPSTGTITGTVSVYGYNQ